MITSKDIRKATKDYKKLKAADGLTDVDKALYDIIKLLVDEVVELNGKITTLERHISKVM